MFIAMTVFLLSGQIANTAPTNESSMNARFIHWQEKSNVIHILVHDDIGRFGIPAIVNKNQDLLFGFEIGDETVEGLVDFLADPNVDVTVSIDGGSEFSIKSGYQPPFLVDTSSGPVWSWDHDGDGFGDRDGDGYGDWNGPIVFFRYLHQGFKSGDHSFVFTYYDNGFALSDEILVSIK